MDNRESGFLFLAGHILMAQKARMWRCNKCGEAVEDSFEVCWSCGTSRGGVEDPEFHAEVDVADTATAPETGRGLGGFWAGAIVTAVVGYIDFLVPYVVAFPRTPWVRDRFDGILAGTAIWSLIMAGGGGVAGQIGGRAKRLADAACKGALILLATQSCLVIVTGELVHFLETPLAKMAAALVNVSALGAIVGSVGTVVGRSRESVDGKPAPIQYSLSEFLFVTTLFGALFASFAILLR